MGLSVSQSVHALCRLCACRMCLSVYASVYQFVQVFVHACVCQCVQVSVYPCMCLSVYACFCACVFVSMQLSVTHACGVGLGDLHGGWVDWRTAFDAE